MNDRASVTNDRRSPTTPKLDALDAQEDAAAATESRQMDSLVEQAEEMISARTIPTHDVVAGDIVLLELGPIAADAYLLSADNLRVNQAVITGTSVLAAKRVMVASDLGQPLTAFPNLVLAGTVVESGTAQAVVLQTGVHTLLGQLLGIAFAPKQRQSPLIANPRRLRSSASLPPNLGMYLLVALSAPRCAKSAG